MLTISLQSKSALTKISIKSIIATFLVIFAVILPQIIHIAGGAQAGITYLPMYFPVLLGGLILGWSFGLVVGVVSPVMSFLFTTYVLGTSMPTLERLPIMVIELAVWGLVSGLFSKLLNKNVWYVIPIVLIAQITGRLVAMVTYLAYGYAFDQILFILKTGILGMILQFAFVPLIIYLLSVVIKKHD